MLINRVIFDGFVEKKLFIQIGGVELDTFDADDRLGPYQRIFTGKPEEWIGTYASHEGEMPTEKVGGWKVWYRIEYSG